MRGVLQYNKHGVIIDAMNAKTIAEAIRTLPR